MLQTLRDELNLKKDSIDVRKLRRFDLDVSNRDHALAIEIATVKKLCSQLKTARTIDPRVVHRLLSLFTSYTYSCVDRLDKFIGKRFSSGDDRSRILGQVVGSPRTKGRRVIFQL